MSELYPLKFKAQYKDKIWGGTKMKNALNKQFEPLPNCGETWEISGVSGNISIVANGKLAGNKLDELIGIYMGDLVGDKVFKSSGTSFPLLIKFIDANDDLSIQVHPDDEVAFKRHNSLGKTEMWYVIEAEKEAKLVSGFKKKVTKSEYVTCLENNKLMDILNAETVAKGDVFFIPAGRVHAIGAGILLAEIQQTSDITYRIYDYDRKDTNGKTRELHTDLALDVIDFSVEKEYKTNYTPNVGESVNIVECKYFKTNVLNLKSPHETDYHLLDSFVIYICLEGAAELQYEGKSEHIEKGDTILIPASLNELKIVPEKEINLLEVWIP